MKDSKIDAVCGHNSVIQHDSDSCIVEFKDGLGHICNDCFDIYTEVENDLLAGTPPNPYGGDKTKYWFDGTKAEFQTLIGKND